MANMKDMFQMVGTGLLKKKVKVSVDTDAFKNANILAKIAEGKAIVRKILSDTALANGFDNIDTACGYAGYTNRYQKLSMQFIAWRGAMWAYFEDYEDEVVAGTKPIPDNISDVIKQAPTFDSFVVN
jgi:hypothetical protein